MADQKKPAPSDDDVLARPGDFHVDQVIAAMQRAPVARVEQVKVAERDDKAREHILNFDPQPVGVSAPASSPGDGVERYTSAGWQERSRWLTVEGRGQTRQAIAGALHDVAPWELLSQAEVERRLEKFLTTPEPELP